MWTSNKMIALYILLALLGVGVGAWFLLRHTLRSRLRMKKLLQADPDMSDWLIVFGWTPKVLYVPTMAASLLASVLMFLKETEWSVLASINPRVIGGVWFAIFIINLIIEEYDVSIKLLIIGVIGLGFLFLWLHLVGWVGGFLRVFRHLGFSISGTGYLLVTLIGLLTIFISWVRGLFYYVAITPNYMNLQEGPTETGEQISREDYNTRIDTGDFVERLFGFGRIVITFKEKSRLPLTLLTWNIQGKAQMLERVRAKFAVDLPQQRPAPAPVFPPAGPPPVPPASPPQP
ncbi:MAG: hypothetical protein RBS72_06835 [Sedimentisphaerales bacterium]|jgi:hypothetical protein|nr:hypothetical protein [Sedimentisphaerales bacterium]HNY78001.1 hypothetical protein [Sedimentisphaerales bacterium]HOC63397.1 hypothetical protein [Sedimentisphaerales bacterium]HOH64073.1 hypothetical protein [Sedimentisphaerales bacterium]HPY49166.1 hypothetical protein [Sedimentisphaerales bacterium]